MTEHHPYRHRRTRISRAARTASALALLCGASAAFVTLWIVIPPLSNGLWLVAIAAGEWSLWWGLLGLIGSGLAWRALARGAGPTAWIPLALGLLAAVLALVPPFQALGAAHASGVPLSLRRYLLGLPRAPRGPRPETETFATVDGKPLRLDVYRPAGPPPAKSRPAVIVVHGGSWSRGDKSDFPHWDRWLAREGFVVFDIQYRLTPQPNWRTATGDVKCAVGWVKRNARRYGVSPDRIALLGRSAGGHLALLAAYTPEEPALPPSCAGVPDTRVAAVVSLYGPTDLVWGYHNPARPDIIGGPATLRRFLGGSPQDRPEAYALASPVNHIGPGDPPTLLLHGGRDTLVGARHTELLAAELRAKGVSHEAVVLPYAQHGFDYPWNGWGAQVVRPVLLRFLRSSLSAPPPRQTAKGAAATHLSPLPPSLPSRFAEGRGSRSRFPADAPRGRWGGREPW